MCIPAALRSYQPLASSTRRVSSSARMACTAGGIVLSQPWLKGTGSPRRVAAQRLLPYLPAPGHLLPAASLPRLSSPQRRLVRQAARKRLQNIGQVGDGPGALLLQAV